jgi:undecaprenyl-diphosphatase
MPILQVIVLGLIQGLTEFLPVSSTAHLYLTSWLLGWQTEALDFDIMLHVGTLLALLLYFFRDWVQIISQAFGLRVGHDNELRLNHMLLWLLVVGTLPIAVVGFLFSKQAETTWRTPWVMGVMLIVVGILMHLAETSSRRSRDLASLNAPDAVVIGVAQALAVIPGTSRSGISISAGLFRNLSSQTAARFSFLLSAPAIAGAAGKAFWDMHKAHQLHAVLETPFLVGVAVSAVTGCVVIAWFMQYLRRSSLRPFVYYRIIFGIIVLALAFIRRPA